MKIAAVIATYNRRQSLQGLLHSLIASEPAIGIEWDAWVVDNNSTDGTREAVIQISKTNPDRIHYLCEVRQGKSYALQTGLRHATGDIIALTDDDCITDPLWFRNIGLAFSSNPQIGIVGGRVELFNAADDPITTRTWQNRRVLGQRDNPFFFIIGCNMAMRRELIPLVGDFDPRIAPGYGRDPVVGEDADFVYRAFQKGIRIEYDPDIVVYHSHGRRSKLDVAKARRSYVRGRGNFYAKYIAKGDFGALRLAYWECRSIFRSLLKNLSKGQPVREECELLWFLVSGAATRLTR